MARIRSVHPGLWTDEAFVSVSRDARLLFIGILNECDDYGVFEWKPLQIKMRLAAGDDIGVAVISGWLTELGGVDLVRRYEVDGRTFGAVRQFQQWQRPKKPTHNHPIPPDIQTYTGPKPKTDLLTDSNDGSDPEPEDDDGPTVPNQSPTGGEVVPNQSPTGGENPSQMEETLRRKEESELRSDICSIPSAPPLFALGADPPKSLTLAERRRSNRGAEPPGFAEWYEQFPRKEGRFAACQAYQKALKAAPAETIMRGLSAYRFAPDREHQPLPETWLNKRRWECEATAAPAQPPPGQPRRSILGSSL